MNQELNLELHRTLSDLLLHHIATDKLCLAHYGLRRVRFYMLRHLYNNPGLSIAELSELSFADAASTSRMVFSMEQDGLIFRKTKDDDRRKKFLWLTDQGKELYESANAIFKEDIHNRFSHIPDEQLSEILVSLQALREALEQHLKSQSSNGLGRDMIPDE